MDDSFFMQMVRLFRDRNAVRIVFMVVVVVLLILLVLGVRSIWGLVEWLAHAAR